MTPNIHLIDVRTSAEYQEAHIDSAINIPLSDIYELTPNAQEALSKLDKNAPIKVHCASGGRSAAACQLLKQRGYTDVENLGGFDDACRCVKLMS